ncbi:MAG: hypothetical protein M4579_003949 [Chaenotheca gracillima]|nr:MAG: hypothetical protein M4579_003949 [Chaenotheca gracillima]
MRVMPVCEGIALATVNTRHINKKGRPVSQCQHCRGLRKSRSAHVKCDCGDKGHRQGHHCAHLDNKADHTSCSCTHGGKCTCALKKEQHQLNPVPEAGGFDGLGLDLTKPPLSNTSSENSLSYFAHGHHKSMHPKNKLMAHNCGAPYKIPRSHGIQKRSHDGLSHTSAMFAQDDATLPLGESFGGIQRDVRLVRSEHGSPHPSSPIGDYMDDGMASPIGFSYPMPTSISTPPPFDLDLTYSTSCPTPPPLELSRSGMSSSAPTSAGPTMRPRPRLDINSVTSAPHDPYFTSTPEGDGAAYSAGLADAPPVDWSSFNLPMDTSAVSSPYSQPPSYASFDYNLSQTAHRPASSGDVSEIDEFEFHQPPPFGGQPSPQRPPSLINNGNRSESSDIWDAESYRLSTASSHHAVPQISMLSTNNLESVDIDDFIKGPTVASSMSGTPPPFIPASAAANDMMMADARMGSPIHGGYSPMEAHHQHHQKMAGPTSVPASIDTSGVGMRYSSPSPMMGPTSAGPDPIWMSPFGSSPAGDYRSPSAQDMAWSR